MLLETWNQESGNRAKHTPWLVVRDDSNDVIDSFEFGSVLFMMFMMYPPATPPRPVTPPLCRRAAVEYHVTHVSHAHGVTESHWSNRPIIRYRLRMHAGPIYIQPQRWATAWRSLKIKVQAFRGPLFGQPAVSIYWRLLLSVVGEFDVCQLTRCRVMSSTVSSRHGRIASRSEAGEYSADVRRRGNSSEGWSDEFLLAGFCCEAASYRSCASN